MSGLPVVVVGAGPVGLAAAAELIERGLEPVVLERGARAGAAVAEWGHVRLFSPWSGLVAPAAERLLVASGWSWPDRSAYPTGQDWDRDYLHPLADALGERIRFGVEVIGLARRGRDRVAGAGRDAEPLTVHVRDAAGVEHLLAARAVVDASGTWDTPNPLGADGLPAIGERAAADRICYRIPDLADSTTRARYAGRHTVVAGSGHSAMTALVVLASLASETPGTRISWILRRGQVGDAFGDGAADRLPARGALGQRARQAVHRGLIQVVTGFRTRAVHRGDDDSLTLVAGDGRQLEGVDEVVALTGFRPELSWLSEIRLELDPVLQAPVRLAPQIDPSIHSCGTVQPHGVTELAHPEPDVYLAGMKSYGRAPTFLAITGYEQVRSIAAALAGDRAAAERVELVLPDTEATGGSGLLDQPDPGTAGSDAAGECCGPQSGIRAVELSGRSGA